MSSRCPVIVLAVVLTGCPLEITERGFLFPRETGAPAELLQPCERRNVEIPVAAGVILRGWALASPKNARWVLWFYGNSRSVAKTVDQQDALMRIFEANVVAVDYRGYGFSDGTPTLEDIGRDALVVYDFVQTTMAHGQPIFAAGHSLGTIPALVVASQRPAGGTILFGTVTSAQDALDMVVRSIPWWQRIWISPYLAPPLRDLKPTPAELIAGVRGPLLMVHGTRDALFPFEHARGLFELAPTSDKTFCAIEQGSHQESVPGSRTTRACLETFARREAARTVQP